MVQILSAVPRLSFTALAKMPADIEVRERDSGLPIRPRVGNERAVPSRMSSMAGGACR